MPSSSPPSSLAGTTRPRLKPRRTSVLKRMRSALIKTFSNDQGDLLNSEDPVASAAAAPSTPPLRQALTESPPPPVPPRSPQRVSATISSARPSLAPLDTVIAAYPLKEPSTRMPQAEPSPRSQTPPMFTPQTDTTAPLSITKANSDRKRPVSQPTPRAIPVVRPASASSARNSLTPQQRAYFLASAPPTPPTSPITARPSNTALKSIFKASALVPSRPVSPPETADGESRRLTSQHQAYKRAFGDVAVHPSLLPRIRSMARILDVGAGNGIWLDDLRTSELVLSDTQLHGSDIAIPPAVPSTVDGFVIHDITKVVPEEGILSPSTRDRHLQSEEKVVVGQPGSYDFVHARLLVYALEKDKWPVALENMTTLLKSGGILQVSEVNCIAHPFRTDVPHPQVDRVNRIATRVMTAFNKEQCAADRMPALFNAAGLRNVRSTRFEIPFGQAARTAGQNNVEAVQSTDTAIGAIAALKAPFLAIGGEEGCRNDEDFARFEHDLRDEIERLGMLFTFVMTIGEKY